MVASYIFGIVGVILFIFVVGSLLSLATDKASMPLRIVREPVTHDFGPGHRTWGHDYTFSPLDGGRRAKLSGWSERHIEVGDYLLIEQSDAADGRTRYRIDTIEHCADPRDMWFATATFAPRFYE